MRTSQTVRRPRTGRLAPLGRLGQLTPLARLDGIGDIRTKSRRLRRWGARQRTWALWLPILMLAANSARADERPAVVAARLQALVDALRTQLSVPQKVTVALVPQNALMASVEPVKGGDGFVLSIESAFANQLTEEELEGVIAHELGHVWIFTHHPYLQTEQLANRIAMRLVSRESLERVYEKVWKDGAKGDLVRFLGEPASPAVASAATTVKTPTAAKTPAKEADTGVVRR